MAWCRAKLLYVGELPQPLSYNELFNLYTLQLYISVNIALHSNG